MCFRPVWHATSSPGTPEWLPLRMTCEPPTCIRRCISGWCRSGATSSGDSLFVARLLSVLCGLGALALTGVIAQTARVPPVPAMLLTLGCYGFTYTIVVARGFALALLLLLGGVACLLRGRRTFGDFALAGALFGAATLTNYLSAFAAGACLLAVGLDAVWPRSGVPSGLTPKAPSWRQAIAALLGFLIFIPADLWWFLEQRDSRMGQFPPFSLTPEPWVASRSALPATSWADCRFTSPAPRRWR